MTAHCISSKISFEPHSGRQITADFNGGRLTSDGGAVLLREVEKQLKLFQRLSDCFTDYRNPGKIEHHLPELLAQRIYGLTLGYEDVNDHDQVRNDMLLAMLCGKTDMSGEERKRKRDQGIPLAGSSTLNRLELGRPDEASGDRYKKIVGDEKEMDQLLVDVFMESHGRPPKEIWLDLDATDDQAYGNQELIGYHGYYDG